MESEQGRGRGRGTGGRGRYPPPPPPLARATALAVGVVSATLGIVSYSARCEYAPSSEQRWVLFPLTVGILVLLSRRGGGGDWHKALVVVGGGGDGLWTEARGQQKQSKDPSQTTSTSSIRQLLGAADAQTAHPATFSTAPTHQLLGSANAETTPARAPAAAANRTQRPDATCERKNG